jgi:hypothetical protein
MLSITRLVLSASIRSASSFGKRSFGHSVSYVSVNNCYYYYYYYTIDKVFRDGLCTTL